MKADYEQKILFIAHRQKICNIFCISSKNAHKNYPTKKNQMVLYIRDKISTSTKASAALYNVMSITKKPSAKKNNKT